MHIVEMLFHGTAEWDPVVCSSWAYCGVYVCACNKHHVATHASHGTPSQSHLCGAQDRMDTASASTVCVCGQHMHNNHYYTYK